MIKKSYFILKYYGYCKGDIWRCKWYCSLL